MTNNRTCVKSSSRVVSGRIRKSLQGTMLSGRITPEAWQYAWMGGLRVEVSEMLGLAPGDRVLDMGCGDGWFSLQNGLMYPEVRFTGIDLYEADEAREVSKAIGATNCRFYAKDALGMGIDGEFDFVVLFMALGNICEKAPSVRRLLANCRRAMKRGAKLLIVEPFEEDFPRAVREELGHLYALYRLAGKSCGEDRETVLSRETTLKALQDSGFGIVKIFRKRFGWHMTRREVMRYFGFDSLPVSIPDRFWVFDRPKQVTIIMAEEASRRKKAS
jgi:ubiquinone/menaquinone biosynthesis C-methylase UbiE